MKTNTFDLQQGISRPQTSSSGSNSFVTIIICCLLVGLAYILGYTAGSYHRTDSSISQGGATHPAYGRFGHMTEPSVSSAATSK